MQSNPVLPLVPATATKGPDTKGPDPKDDAGFRRLLEQLEAMQQHREPARPVEDASALVDALHRADEDYLRMMELQQQLEQQYRKRLS